MRISQRLKDIEYQVLKNLWFEPTDAQLVRMVKRIMYSALREAASRGEDLSAFAVDPSRPTSIMGVALNFATEGENVGKVFSLERGEITLNEDLETAPTDLGHIPTPLPPIPTPVMISVTISPSSPTSADDLTAIAQATVEGDAPITFTYSWTRDGSQIPGATSPTLSSSEVYKNSQYSVSVTPTATGVSGSPLWATSVMALGVPPIIDNVEEMMQMGPSAVTFSYTVTASSPEGEALSVTHQYFFNDTVVSTQYPTVPVSNITESSWSYPRSYTASDELRFVVTVTDGTHTVTATRVTTGAELMM